MKKWLLRGSAVLLIGATAYSFTAGAGKQIPGEVVAAPDFTLPDPQDKPVSLSSFRGKVVLLDFFETWCEPCQEEVPGFKKLYAQYRGRGFVIVGVALDANGKDVVASFIKAFGVTYPVLVSGGVPPKGYRFPGIPAAFMIDRQGRVKARYLGELTFEDLSKDVEAELAQAAAAAPLHGGRQ